MIGAVQQRPPIFSALKIGGRRAYDLARRGNPVNLPPRPVRIDAIDILSYDWPLVKISVDCGRGTYIRSIARDLGDLLAVGGYLTHLRRSKVGPFLAAESVGLERLCADGVAPYLKPLPVP
jgi:tRNA pseudouridine55 synthase